MEETKKLGALVKQLEKTLRAANKAKTIDEVDQIKKTAIKNWREVQLQLNRAYRETRTVPQAARDRVLAEGQLEALRAIHVSAKVEEAPVIPVTDAPKATPKKTSREAKK